MAKIIYINHMQVASGAQLELQRHDVGLVDMPADMPVTAHRARNWLVGGLAGWIVFAALGLLASEMAKVARARVKLDDTMRQGETAGKVGQVGKVGTDLAERDRARMRQCAAMGQAACDGLSEK